MEEIVAHAKFRLLATMNPGGDFGKRELSPALRNRFTEIWVPPICDVEDLRSIVTDRLVGALDSHPYQNISWTIHLDVFLFFSCMLVF